MVDKYSYRISWSSDDNEFVGLCSEFPSLSFLAPTQDQAFKGIRRVVAEVLEDMIKNKEVIPEALVDRNFSGKFMVRVPPDLHRTLALEALEARVSLNRYISSKLAARSKYLSAG